MTKKIAVIPGDGIGPEVIDAGLRVLNRVNDAHNLGLELVHFGWNADEFCAQASPSRPAASFAASPSLR